MSPEIDMERVNVGQATKRMDQYKRFWQPTLADGQLDFYGPLKPIIGFENSVAYFERGDMPSFLIAGHAAQEMAINGQDGLCIFITTSYTQELKLTPSIDGTVVSNIFSNKMEYSQTQTVHEYQHQPERKRGLFNRGGG